MRWLLLALTVFGLLLALSAHTPGRLGLGLALLLLGALASVFAFAQARIHGSARDEQLSDQQIAALRASLKSTGRGTPSDTGS
ncbi:MAG: hypothetical protein KGI40_00385 [Xanthomonadaceae bacterium]|nr:hypothetical protein [Xanthomonadaceae bacterium]MDE2177331.1 hypothetical protein [Xanthomonadaceae bacterium]